jgi:ribosomal protein S18 acetylase RimI-like enzyme
MMQEEISETKYQIIEGETSLLELTKLAEKVYAISKLTDIESEDTYRSLGERLQHFCLKENIEILSVDHPKSERKNKFIETNGFSLIRQKAFFQKDLRETIIPTKDTLSYRSLAEIGMPSFLEIFDIVSIGDKERTSTAEAFLQELIDIAGASYSPQNWLAVYESDIPVGAILPQPYDDNPLEGSIFYIGILPDHRNKGLGTILHAKGLTELKRSGCHTYIGSTDVSNQSMLKVFAKNKCERTSTQLFYKCIPYRLTTF